MNTSLLAPMLTCLLAAPPQPASKIEFNRDIMAKYRDQMRPLYYDPAKYKTYLEQLGIKYPVIKKQP